MHWTHSPHNCLQNHTLEFGAIPIYLPKPSTKLGSGCYPKLPGSQNTLQNQALSKMVVNQAFMQPISLYLFSLPKDLYRITLIVLRCFVKGTNWPKITVFCKIVNCSNTVSDGLDSLQNGVLDGPPGATIL